MIRPADASTTPTDNVTCISKRPWDVQRKKIIPEKRKNAVFHATARGKERTKIGWGRRRKKRKREKKSEHREEKSEETRGQGEDKARTRNYEGAKLPRQDHEEERPFNRRKCCRTMA